MATRIITTLALLPLVAGGQGLRANQREAQECDCDPYNYQYDLECCGPACAFPDSRFYDIELCSCDPCDVQGSCYAMEHCCDPCMQESSCFSEETCCDKCDPRSYCFDFYADCDIHYGAQATNIEVDSMTVSAAGEGAENATIFYDTAGAEIEPEIIAADAMTYGGSDEYYDVDERPLYAITVDAFSPARLGGRAEGMGEIYPFGSRVTSASDTTENTVNVNAGGWVYPLFITHEGYCTRTSTTGSVRGFCHWQYTIDEVGTFVASGGLGDPSEPSTLAIEGGTGMLIGATGSVTIYGAAVNSASFPNVAQSGTDPFAGVDGYLHAIRMYADDAFSDGSTNGVFETMAPTTPLSSPSNAPSAAPSNSPSAAP
mmetsp:Transcript_29898/g.71838  ORF Transcript_29898/g.71838 Transcript_29898/m.71838 type:complete len:372 (+) Transcript_29898:40-1155(+)|eukprot:CAMPEP_0113626238 /NCGR_PEP_ID=MMETSP0017_2-20120614/13570_1 /TAXON_ID=2856 /ORGANISM="Cylindrotheca closterium" /LENGTH=371 /DNA_ID=CAMNT_0000536413 /DNA_START=40 /DNA_END=1155 /DNA_ORIENTATION=- /assembly_acc=CAM_ASM_000147